MAEVNLEIVSNVTERKISIILADDHPLLRHALRDVLKKQTDFEIVAEAKDGIEAVKLATELLPDIVVMDISMPRLNGLEATRQIKSRCPHIAILVLTVHSDNEHILGIFEAGAAGYLTKSAYEDEIVNAIRLVIAGEAVVPSSVFQQIFQHTLKYMTKPIVLEAGEKLTARELEILKLAAMGMNNKDIGRELNISLRTVKYHLVEVFSKLNVSSRTEAVITGLRAGLLTLNDLK